MHPTSVLFEEDALALRIAVSFRLEATKLFLCDATEVLLYALLLLVLRGPCSCMLRLRAWPHITTLVQHSGASMALYHHPKRV